MASTYLTRTTGTPTDNKKYTFSAWIKRFDISAGNSKIFSRTWGSGGEEKLEWNQDTIVWRNTSGGGGATNWERVTNRKFRDCSGWYHIVVAFDSTQNTSDDGDRIKMYINGVQETSFSSSSYPSLNADSAFMDSGITQNYGRYASGGQETSAAWSHVHLIDGLALAPTVFGETDSTTGEWKIITSPTISDYGNNGFFIFKNSANLSGSTVQDQSGKGNNLSVTGTLTNTEDNPSNVFATFNPLDNYHAGGTFTNGNTKYTSVSSKHDFTVSTLAMHSGSGKFYAEFKVHQDTDYNMIGISDHSYQGSNQELSEDNYSYGYYNDGSASAVRGNGSTVLSNMPTYGDGDIICVAVDLDNHKLYFRKNDDAWINSGDPTSGSTGTGAVSINNLSTTPNTDARGQGVYFFGAGMWNSSYSGTYSANFGNGYFGTTAVSSAGTNASGIGIFEYDVPTGYTALSTKGLNE